MSRKEDLQRLEAELVADIEDEKKDTDKYARQAEEARRLNMRAATETLLTISSQENHHADLIQMCLGSLRSELVSVAQLFEVIPRREAVPMPGDIVTATKSDDILIKPGAKGVIEGMENQRKSEYEVTFNWSPLPWWDEGAITSSGGPSRFIKASDLKYTGRTEDQDFQYFPHGMGANMAEVKKHTVLVWEIDLTQYGTRPSPQHEEARKFRKPSGLFEHIERAETATNYEEKAREARARGSLAEAAALETMARIGAMLPSENTYEITKRHIYSLAEKLHQLVYDDQKRQNPSFGEETWQLWSKVVISEKRDWWYIDIHSTRFSVGKYTGDTYRESTHIGKIAQLTAEDLFKAM